jgi:NAD(P)-dependent dehydrogenase (short-subunit alcohol dehydrogenase family)
MSNVLKGAVVIVTGAGRGVGAGIAKLAAAEGAKVVVNDLGASEGGEGSDLEPAQQVVEEIRRAGGEAIANGANVASWDGAHELFAAAMKAFGNVDAIINNAGILRDTMFHKMSEPEFDSVVAVNLKGCFNVARAAAPHFKSKEKGCFVHMTSTSGLIGNFGQTNYGAAKLGLVGFMNTLKLEGAKDNIKVNAICPVAATRMTENLMPQQALDMLKPEYVTPGVVFLASEEAPTGVVLAAGAGIFSAAQIVESNGINLGHGADADTVAEYWSKISDFTGAKHYTMGGEQTQKLMERLQEKPVKA